MDKYMQIPLGVQPSPPDPRDYKIQEAFAVVKSAITTFPKSYRIEYPGQVENQGNIGACVAMTLAAERATTEKRQTSEYCRFSPGWVYVNRKGTIGELLAGEGMVPRDALKNLQKYGAVRYEDFPHLDTYKNLLPLHKEKEEELYRKAYPYRISTYYRIDENGDPMPLLKESLMNGWPVMVVVPVYRSFYDTKSNGIVKNPDTENEKYYGLHAMLCLGWDEKDRLIVLNSWGKEWGDGGWCYMPQNYPYQELWVVTDDIDRYEIELRRIYEDGDKISSWARKDVYELYEAGLMKGDGRNFKPKDPLTREEAAVMFNRLRKWLVN